VSQTKDLQGRIKWLPPRKRLLVSQSIVLISFLSILEPIVEQQQREPAVSHPTTMPVVTPEKLASLQRQSQDIRNVNNYAFS
jgi:hypothetical protein